MTTLVVRNRMSANALKEQQHDKINFCRNTRTGKLFFTCGSKTGYIPQKIAEAHANNTLDINNVVYAECRKADLPDTEENWVPCLMAKSTANVEKSY